MEECEWGRGGKKFRSCVRWVWKKKGLWKWAERASFTRQKSSSGRLLPPPSASAGLCERETGLRTHTAHAHTHTHTPPLCISHHGRGRGTRRSRAKEEECSSTGALAHPSPLLRPIRSLSAGASTHARTLGGTLLSPPPPGQGPIDPALYPPDPPAGRVAPVTRPPRHKKDEQRDEFRSGHGVLSPGARGPVAVSPTPSPLPSASQVERQIDQMVRFIRQEAEEKAAEIAVAAEEVRERQREGGERRSRPPRPPLPLVALARAGAPLPLLLLFLNPRALRRPSLGIQH